MRITIDNQNEIDKISFHDDVFSGFEYDYRNNVIVMSLTDGGGWHNSKRTLRFISPMWFSVQACKLWTAGNSIMYLLPCEEPTAFTELQRNAKKDSTDRGDSFADHSHLYLSLEVLLNSGDTIHIVCESIDFTEIPR